jgi:hypothetical protein
MATLWVLQGGQMDRALPASLGAVISLTSLVLTTCNAGSVSCDYAYQLGGTIPPELGSLTSLETLNLAGQGLTGPIPAALSFLTNLKSLCATRVGVCTHWRARVC